MPEDMFANNYNNIKKILSMQNTIENATFIPIDLTNKLLCNCSAGVMSLLTGQVVTVACLLWFSHTGAHTVIHPKARIVAEAGPIIIGDNNLIEEQVEIINR